MSSRKAKACGEFKHLGLRVAELVVARALLPLRSTGALAAHLGFDIEGMVVAEEDVRAQQRRHCHVAPKGAQDENWACHVAKE